eukprot:6440984-Amphidinium_carterae.2
MVWGGGGRTRGAACTGGRNACMLHNMGPISVTAAANGLSAGCAGPVRRGEGGKAQCVEGL